MITLARTDVREAVVDLPDSATPALAIGASFQVTLQADPTIATTGKVREIAPQADTATRSRRVKITLDRVVDAFRLGATITARPMTSSSSAIEIPVTALLERDGSPRVWVVDASGKTVRTVPVQVAVREGDVARLAGGIDIGTRVVVAGVNSLTEGQTVKIDQELPQ